MNTNLSTRAALLAASTAAFSPFLMTIHSAAAQDAGGVQMSLTTTQQLSSQQNGALIPAATDRTTTAQSLLNVSFSSETRTEKLSFSALSGLRASSASGGGDTDLDIVDPRLALTYARTGADSALNLSASATLTDISFARPLSDFLDPDTGQLALPSDFDDLVGSGTRTGLSFAGTLSLRDDAPFGITLGVGVTDLSYRDVTSAALRDSRSVSASVTGRFDITPVLTASAGLSYLTNEEDGSAQTDQLNFSGRLLVDRPDGSYGLNFGLTDLQASRPRLSAGFSRSYQLRDDTRLSGALGLVRTQAGNIDTTGSLSLSYSYPLGTISAGFNRAASTDTDGSENLVTSLSLGTTRALTPDSRLALNASFAQSEDTGTGISTSLSSLGASYSHDLTADWALSAGVTLSSRDSTGAAQANAAGIDLTLTRTFDLRR